MSIMMKKVRLLLELLETMIVKKQEEKFKN